MIQILLTLTLFLSSAQADPLPPDSMQPKDSDAISKLAEGSAEFLCDSLKKYSVTAQTDPELSEALVMINEALGQFRNQIGSQLLDLRAEEFATLSAAIISGALDAHRTTLHYLTEGLLDAFLTGKSSNSTELLKPEYYRTTINNLLLHLRTNPNSEVTQKILTSTRLSPDTLRHFLETMRDQFNAKHLAHRAQAGSLRTNATTISTEFLQGWVRSSLQHSMKTLRSMNIRQTGSGVAATLFAKEYLKHCLRYSVSRIKLVFPPKSPLLARLSVVIGYLVAPPNSLEPFNVSTLERAAATHIDEAILHSPDRTCQMIKTNSQDAELLRWHLRSALMGLASFQEYRKQHPPGEALQTLRRIQDPRKVPISGRQN